MKSLKTPRNVASLTVDAVILSIPGREIQLKQCIESVEQVVDKIILVWNSDSEPPVVSSDSCDIEIHSAFCNLGVSEGRNYGTQFSNADLVLFIDDDALLKTEPQFRTRCEKMLLDQQCVITTFKVMNESQLVERHHDPRLFKFKSYKPCYVGTFLGGACLVRREQFLINGGFYAELTYGMEEWDFSLRAHDNGYRIFFDTSVILFHPARKGHFSEQYWANIFTNRMIVADRNLGLLSKTLHLSFRFILLAKALRLPTAFSVLLFARKQSERVTKLYRKPISFRTHLTLLKLRRPAFL